MAIRLSEKITKHSVYASSIGIDVCFKLQSKNKPKNEKEGEKSEND